MAYRLAALLAIAACNSNGDAPPDAVSDDAPIDAPDAPDAPAVDTTPPALVSVAPDADEVWLHEPLALTFDEPLSIAGAAVYARLDSQPVAAQLALSGDRTIVVTLDPAARGVGALGVRVTGVADVAGNAVAQPIEVARAVTAWSRPSVDRGVASGTPAVAVGDGVVYAAWIAGGAVVASAYDRGAWRSLGDPLGGGAASAAIAIGGDGRPVVAWIDGGVARAARWDGAFWTALPSPGSGDHVALANQPGGGAVTALVTGGTAQVRALANDAWAPLGDLAGPAGEPAIAVAAADRVAVGWIAGGSVRVFRYTGAWTAMAPIALGAPPSGVDRLSLAARDTTIAVAWDQWGGSFGVFAARATGATTAWTRLGRLLDVDPQADATAPAIALDAAGTPIVAWRERIEGVDRGVLASWSGSAWAIVGGPTWLIGASPSPPALALHAGGAPVVAWTAGGALGVARFNGPRVADFGIQQRTPLAGCSFNPANPPARILATGCFTLAAPGRPVPHAGLVPYDIVVELWSDGAKKRRWIALPDGASMTTSSTGAWAAPAGTFIVKEFALETTTGDPASRRAIETRVLARSGNGWLGFSYMWRPDGSDADLLNDGTYTYDWQVDGAVHTHYYPSRSACLSCHESSYGPLLGLRPQQLARWFDYGGTIADQLPTLAHLGVGPGSTVAPFISSHDPSATSEQRMRSYMAANCAHCHNPQHIAIKDLRYTTPLADTNLCATIVPGSPPQSRVYELVTERPGMPALGSLYVDPLAQQLLGDWITKMTSCP